MLTILRLATLFLLPAIALGDRALYINNLCPTDITLYISAVPQRSIPRLSSVSMIVPNNYSGSFYSSTNGGMGTGRLATEAVFRLENGYYYILKDPTHFNMGVSIAAHSVQPNGFCTDALCDVFNCPNAFSLPSIPTNFPPPTNVAPSLPMHQCPGDNIGFTISFCPSGTFPPTDVSQIHPVGNGYQCLDVRGNIVANGTPVQIYECNGSTAQNWVIKAGSTKVQLAGTNFCLDAGSTPANGVGMKIWQCYDNLPAQQWYLTDDDRIALEGQGLCLDVTNGNFTSGNQVQTWQCTNNNLNQAWTH
ncbi:hypothetical protein ONZ45_g7709 [Pleurotus djamor]|nr:hypothetical protein ONZ45_g7709 [Pleurotus djamor]